ncbi:MAG: SpoIIE family protein phosphatase, partial [Deltaproteobacteria bacterium]|nr:SpoIIE family protein phosphatase [Deltaproteobacteria bacterium]
HQAARSTRGAAATVVRVDRAARQVTVAGVGNVGAWLVDGNRLRMLVTQHGTLGHAQPSQVRQETYPFPRGTQVVVCSDGLKSRLEAPPALFSHPPATVATVLWRDHTRGRDDATAAVLQES